MQASSTPFGRAGRFRIVSWNVVRALASASDPLGASPGSSTALFRPQDGLERLCDTPQYGPRNLVAL